MVYRYIPEEPRGPLVPYNVTQRIMTNVFHVYTVHPTTCVDTVSESNDQVVVVLADSTRMVT